MLCSEVEHCISKLQLIITPDAYEKKPKVKNKIFSKSVLA